MLSATATAKRARAASELNSDTETSADQDKSGDSGEADQRDCRVDVHGRRFDCREHRCGGFGYSKTGNRSIESASIFARGSTLRDGRRSVAIKSSTVRRLCGDTQAI